MVKIVKLVVKYHTRGKVWEDPRQVSSSRVYRGGEYLNELVTAPVGAVGGEYLNELVIVEIRNNASAIFQKFLFICCKIEFVQLW